MSNPLADGIPFGTRLAQLAAELGDRPAVTVVGLDGGASSMSFAELDTRANQWGRALAANIGTDGSGTHCTSSSQSFDINLSTTPVRVDVLPVEENAEMRQAIREFFLKTYQPAPAARALALIATLPALFNRISNMVRNHLGSRI